MQRKDAAVFTFNGTPSPGLSSFAENLRSVFEANGYSYEEHPEAPRLVINFITPERARPYRRHSKATFVVSVIELPEMPDDPVRALYPYLVRALSNMMIAYTPGEGAHFLTLELGHYMEPEGPAFYERVYARVNPIACSVLVIDNIFEPTLEPELWEGDDQTKALYRAGKKLAEWDLLPAPFPIETILPPEDLRHVKRLYGIGGLSYGNLSARKDARRFWMSASGVDKSNLREIGRDLLLVKDYDEEQNAIVLQIPPEVTPRRVSVDAIEHWMIYREHPQVNAIIHVHAWMDGVPSTPFNYPCGTYQLAEAVADKIRQAPDPSRAVVGLKNHGLTITGRSVDDILERIDGRLLPQVPMS